MSDPATLVDLAGINITAGSLGIMASMLVGGITFWFKVRAEGREIRKEQASAREAADKLLDARFHPLEVAVSTFKTKEELAEDRNSILREVDDLRHDIRNERGRIDALDSKRQESDRWAAKVDLTIANIEKGQARIEAQMEKNHKETLDQMKTWAEQFSASIREVRNVAPKG
jgi:chromosome segregation ATPase